jgi:2-C-methyl-D-erythritol 4-phosphate cytidylyltransferase
MASNVFCILPAAGSGRRTGLGFPKQYALLNGRTVLERTLERLLPLVPAHRLVLVVDDSFPGRDPGVSPDVLRVVGGCERIHSVLAGLRALSSTARPDDWVLVHDVARPLVRPQDIQKLMAAVWAHPDGGLLATPVQDTLKSVVSGEVAGTVDRSGLWRALTPQMFRYGRLCSALETSIRQGLMATDESAAIERIGGKPLVVEGASDNLKITGPHDLALAELIWKQQENQG